MSTSRFHIAVLPGDGIGPEVTAALMLEWLGESQIAARIENAVRQTLADPTNRTADLRGTKTTTQLSQIVTSYL